MKNNDAAQLSDNFIARYILGRLTDEETNALIDWVIKNGEESLQKREREVMRECMKTFDFNK